jgi:hypothetical protein
MISFSNFLLVLFAIGVRGGGYYYQEVTVAIADSESTYSSGGELEHHACTDGTSKIWVALVKGQERGTEVNKEGFACIDKPESSIGTEPSVGEALGTVGCLDLYDWDWFLASCKSRDECAALDWSWGNPADGTDKERCSRPPNSAYKCGKEKSPGYDWIRSIEGDPESEPSGCYSAKVCQARAKFDWYERECHRIPEKQADCQVSLGYDWYTAAGDASKSCHHKV